MQLTLLHIIQDGRILLGKKKRGFGTDKWNGFGGKVLKDETFEEAAIRECIEETGVTPREMKPYGKLVFHYQDDPDIRETHLFVAKSFTGDVVETEEMVPQWFTFSEIPYQDMWADDIYWLPLLLGGKKLEGEFYFDGNQTISDFSLREL